MIHSQKERRYRCKRCAKTFSETKGTALYRVHKPHELVATVVTLLAYGCPVQAIVAGFGLDERTVARWQREGGHQCRRRLHEHIVQAGGVLLAQLQADELRIRIVGGVVVWLASALSVTSRLWLGGVLQIRRDRCLIRRLLQGVRACGAFEDLLLCTAMGWQLTPSRRSKCCVNPSAPESEDDVPPASFARGHYGGPGGQEVCSTTGDRGSPACCPWHGGRGGRAAEVHPGRHHRGGDQHCLHIERLQATFRSRLAPLVRRTRAARRVRRRRWRQEGCGWWAPCTTSAGHTSQLASS